MPDPAPADTLSQPAEANVLAGAKVDPPFNQEMGKMFSRPHRLFLLIVIFLLLYSGVRAAQAEPLKVLELTLDASKWVLGIIGGLGLARSSGLGKKAVDGARRSLASPPPPAPPQ